MPVFTNSQQVTLVLQSLLLGVGIGAVYDMLRALRLHFRCGWAGAALFDTMFWAIVLAALFEFGLIAAAGQPRGFVLLTAAGGMGLYFAALSETVLEAIMRLLQVLAKLRRAVYGLRMHCQTVVKQRCSPVKIRFLTKKFEKDSFLFRKKGMTRRTRMILIRAAVVVFLLYAVVNVVNLRTQIKSKRDELASLTLRVEEYQKANETLRQEMQSGISEEDIGEMARTELGYAEPGERIFVDTSSR